MLVMAKRNRIDVLRKQRGLSIYRLAKNADLTYQATHALVKAEEIPDGTSYGTLRKIADVLEVSITELETED